MMCVSLFMTMVVYRQHYGTAVLEQTGHGSGILPLRMAAPCNVTQSMFAVSGSTCYTYILTWGAISRVWTWPLQDWIFSRSMEQ